jgi:hypothetical protein
MTSFARLEFDYYLNSIAFTGLIFGMSSVGKNRDTKHTRLVPAQTAATCQPIIFTGATEM